MWWCQVKAKNKLSDICSRDIALFDRAISGLNPMNQKKRGKKQEIHQGNEGSCRESSRGSPDLLTHLSGKNTCPASDD